MLPAEARQRSCCDRRCDAAQPGGPAMRTNGERVASRLFRAMRRGRRTDRFEAREPPLRVGAT